jgi:hypothetical protein
MRVLHLDKKFINSHLKVNRFPGPVVQLNRTSDSGSEGRGFESLRGHKVPCYGRALVFSPGGIDASHFRPGSQGALLRQGTGHNMKHRKYFAGGSKNKKGHPWQDTLF